MLNTTDILSTIDMIREQKLDIRTITMGISLLDCVGTTMTRLRRVYDLITRRAERLVQTGEDIESEFGIPIVNKRISVTPVALLLAGAVRPGATCAAGPRPRGRDDRRELRRRLFRAGAEGHDRRPTCG